MQSGIVGPYLMQSGFVGLYLVHSGIVGSCRMQSGIVGPCLMHNVSKSGIVGPCLMHTVSKSVIEGSSLMHAVSKVPHDDCAPLEHVSGLGIGARDQVMQCWGHAVLGPYRDKKDISFKATAWGNMWLMNQWPFGSLHTIGMCSLHDRQGHDPWHR